MIRIQHSHGLTEYAPSLDAALESVASVYGADYAIEGVEYLEAGFGPGRCLVWVDEETANNDDGSRACCALTLIGGEA